MSYIAAKRLFLTADQSRVVDVASSEAGYLFRAAGQPVSQAEVDRYDLHKQGFVRPIRPEATDDTAHNIAEVKAETEPPNIKAELKPSKKKATT